MTTSTPPITKTNTKKTSTKSTPKRAVSPVSGRGAKKVATPPTSPTTGATNATAPVVVRRPPKEPKACAMQAALIVLKDAPPEGISAKDMIDAMGGRKLWTSPGGKTPEASLYASIIREIAKKGESARFRKVSRGRFVLR